jgi:dolichol-phosphate mannosyltransferase
MDADFTQHPSYIPALLEYKDTADIVIGSRYIAGGAMHNWSGVRLPFTYFWRNAIKYGLGMKYDCTGAFRLYSVEKLNPELYLNFRSRGFSFCIESLFHLHYAGLKIQEIPIQAYNRLHGSSKLSGAIMREGATTFLRLLFSKKRRSQ